VYPLDDDNPKLGGSGGPALPPQCRHTNDPRPGGGGLDKAGADGVLEDVLLLFEQGGGITGAVVEKIALPFYARGFRSVGFPRSHSFGQFRIGGNSNQPMHMVGHNEKQTQPPAADFVIMDGGVKQMFWNAGFKEGLRFAVGGANGDEEDFATGDPSRRVMRQRLAGEIFRCRHGCAASRCGSVYSSENENGGSFFRVCGQRTVGRGVLDPPRGWVFGKKRGDDLHLKGHESRRLGGSRTPRPTPATQLHISKR